ncbi:MAG: glycoside hydrolase family 127 protein [Clostridia bacterium]
MIGRAIFNKTPLPPNRLAPLPLGAVQPGGWLAEQIALEVAAVKGSRASLSARSCWLGGSDGDYESGAEALAALTPLAFVSGDETLKELVTTAVEWSIESQVASGDFGPKGESDWWPKMLMLRVLRLYFTATGDKRALKLMERFFRFELVALETCPLADKACARAGENIFSALWLYNLTEQKHLIKLCELLKAQSLDWTDEFHIFPHIRPTAKQRPFSALREGMAREGDTLCGIDQKVNGREYHLTEATNIAFGLRTPGVVNLFKSGFKEVGAFRVGWNKLMKQHGVALSMYTGDHHLAGADPVQGVDLSAVSEMINTLSTLIGTGDEFGQQMPDTMEKLAFNALPAAFNADMTRRQAIEQVNQVPARGMPHSWYNAKEDAAAYEARPVGLADQGFAAFAASLWYATSDDGLAAVSYAPCTVGFIAGGERVRIKVETTYPFEEKITIKVETRAQAEFPIYLRIPEWAGQIIVKLPDGELMQMQGGETACVRRKWLGEAVIEMELPMQPRLTRWFHRSGAVELGPLLMCLRVKGKQAWNWALCGEEPMKVVMEPRGEGAFKQGGDTLHVLVKAARAIDWKMEGADCATPPIAPEVGDPEQVLELMPFGATDARITQFPII